MNRIYFFLLLCVSSGVHAHSQMDNLDAPTLHEDKTYSSLLNGKLALTSADCGRMIVAPSFVGESALSIYSSEAKSLNQKTYFITLTRAAQNLYQAGAQAKDVTVERIDAEIPKKAALSVRAAWLTMLRSPERSQPESSLDGQTVEFSIECPSGASLYGDLPDTRGPRTEKLWKLGMLLTKYALAKPAERGSLAMKIKQDADALAASAKAEK